MGGSVTIRRIILSLAVGLLFMAGVLPVLVMLWRSLVLDGRISFDAYRDLLNSRAQWRLMAGSLGLAGLCTLVSTVCGLLLGILLGKTDLPCRGILTALFTLPLVLPPYVLAVAWFHILGREGSVRSWLGPAVAEVTSDAFFGLAGCVWVLSSVFTPVIMLLTIAFLRCVNPRQEEAGRLVAPWPHVLLRVTVPAILPAVGAGALLVFILTLGEFGVPSFLRVPVFAVETLTRFAAFYDFRGATAAALPLIVLTLLALMVERFFLHRRTAALQSARGFTPLIVPLGRYRKPCLVLIGLGCFLGVLLPLLVLFGESLAPGAYSLALSHAGASLVRSLLYAGLGASALTVTGFLLGTLIHERASSFGVGLDSVTLFLFALPGTVLGIGLILLWNRPATNIIYQSALMLLLGWTARYSALTSRITVAALGQIPASMVEAARLAGAGWLRCIGQIVLPMARPGLVVAWLAAFLFCMRETGLSMLVYAPGRDTLPVRTFTLMANGAPELIAALCIIMVLGTVLPLSVLSLIWKRGVVRT